MFRTITLITALGVLAACDSEGIDRLPALDTAATPTAADPADGAASLDDQTAAPGSPANDSGSDAAVNDTTDGSASAPIDVAYIYRCCLLYTSPSPRDGLLSRMPSSA